MGLATYLEQPAAASREVLSTISTNLRIRLMRHLRWASLSLSLSLLGGYGPARVATMNPGWVGATQLSVNVWETI